MSAPGATDNQISRDRFLEPKPRPAANESMNTTNTAPESNPRNDRDTLNLNSGEEPSATSDESAPIRLSFWTRAITFAGLIVLGVTPFAHAQLAPPNLPALCPPLTSIATPSFFNLFWGTSPIRFPYQ